MCGLKHVFRLCLNGFYVFHCLSCTCCLKGNSHDTGKDDSLFCGDVCLNFSLAQRDICVGSRPPHARGFFPKKNNCIAFCVRLCSF